MAYPTAYITINTTIATTNNNDTAATTIIAYMTTAAKLSLQISLFIQMNIQ